MTCGQLFPLFCDDPGLSHAEARISHRINYKILEAALTPAQPKNEKNGQNVQLGCRSGVQVLQNET